MDLSLFENGRYDVILADLQKERDGSGSRSLAEQLSHKNNIAVCSYLLGKDEEEKKRCNLEFVDVLKKCRSVPAGEEILCVELGSLYNYMYHVTGIHSSNNDRSAAETDLYNQAYRAFSRVYRMLSQQKYPDSVLSYTEIRTAVYAMINNALEKLQYGIGLENLTVTVCQCILPLARHEIENKDHSSLYKLLNKAKTALRNTETNVYKQQALCLPLWLEHSELHVMNKGRLEDTIVLLMGMCQCKDSAWDEAFDTLDEIHGQHIRSVAQFFCGFALFKTGKYTESISSLMALIRSGQALTQRLKARIYNLIGKCFQKLNKCQLSIQMFKEALCADFSYLVPLFNTSLQYRNQGVEDVELECLNLLVTALGMREKLEGYNTMELVCLLNMEDEDIPFIQALYTLCSRSLQLKRYDVAAEKYVSLLDYLKSWKMGTQEVATCIPPLLQVHHEAIEALLMSKQYKECVALCDRVLLCYHNNTCMSGFNESSLLSQTFDLTLSQPQASDSQGERGKRKFDDFNQSQDDEHFGDVDVVALKYKAMALVKMGDNSGSLVCLERAINSIKSYRKFRMHHKMKAVTESLEPRSKRQKLDNTSHTVKEKGCNSSDDHSPSTSADTSSSRKVFPSSQNTCDRVSVLSELFKNSGRMLDLEQDLYEMTAEVLASMEKYCDTVQPSDSVHYKRLASQIQSLKDFKN